MINDRKHNTFAVVPYYCITIYSITNNSFYKRYKNTGNIISKNKNCLFSYFGQNILKMLIIVQ